MEGKTAVALCALLLLASFGCVGSGGTTPSGTGFWVWNWNIIAAIAFAIVALLLAIGYMASVLLGDDKMRAFVKKELGQLAISAMLIIFVTGAFIWGMDSLLKSVITMPGITDGDWQNYVNNAVCCDTSSGQLCPMGEQKMPCHIAVAQDFLELLYEGLKISSISFFLNHWFSAFFSFLNVSLSARVVVSVASLSIRPFAFMSLNADMFSILFDLAMKNMMLVRVQQVFIDFMLVAFFPVMLSMGLVLRIFYFTRKLGGLLIALSLSMYYVFPMFYVLSDAIFFELVGGWTVDKPPDLGVGFDQTESMPFMEQPWLFNATGLADLQNQLIAGGYVTGTEELGRLDDFADDAEVDAIALEGDDGRQYIVKKDPVDQYKFSAYGQFAEFESGASSSFSTPTNVMDICGDPSQEDIDYNVNNANMFEKNWEGIQGGAYVNAGNFISLNAFSIGGPMASLAALMVFTLVTPFLALMTTLAAFKQFSGMLGGDVEIALISRLL